MAVIYVYRPPLLLGCFDYAGMPATGIKQNRRACPPIELDTAPRVDRLRLLSPLGLYSFWHNSKTMILSVDVR